MTKQSFQSKDDVQFLKFHLSYRSKKFELIFTADSYRLNILNKQVQTASKLFQFPTYILT